MVKSEDLVYGENAVKMTFEPQDKTSPFKAKTVEKTFNATYVKDTVKKTVKVLK